MAIEQGSGRLIEVKVRVYAGLRSHLPGVPLGQSVALQLRPDATVGEALEELGIPLAETKTCFVNGVQRGFGFQLKEGDELAAFPPIAGGST